MRKKRVLFALLFIVLIATKIAWVLFATATYTYDDGPDLHYFIAWIFSIPVYIAEIDLFYELKYFWVDKAPKGKLFSAFNIVATILSVIILFATAYIVLNFYSTDSYVSLITIIIIPYCTGGYIILRILYAILNALVCAKQGRS